MYDIKKIFASNLKRIRKRLNLTQEKFGEYVDLDWKSIVNYENDRNLPNAISLEKICNKLEISPAELFFVTDDDEIVQEKINSILVLLNKMDKRTLDLVYKLISVIDEDKTIPK